MSDLTLVLVKIGSLQGGGEKEFVLSILNTVNRPNNPSIEEIVGAYVFYSYGYVFYNFKEIEDTTMKIESYIGETWNIENHQ
jgi:hypothetical protein